MRTFMGIDFMTESVPDATTLLKEYTEDHSIFYIWICAIVSCLRDFPFIHDLFSGSLKLSVSFSDCGDALAMVFLLSQGLICEGIVQFDTIVSYKQHI